MPFDKAGFLIHVETTDLKAAAIALLHGLLESSTLQSDNIDTPFKLNNTQKTLIANLTGALSRSEISAIKNELQNQLKLKANQDSSQHYLLKISNNFANEIELALQNTFLAESSRAKKRWKYALSTIKDTLKSKNINKPLIGLTDHAYHLEKIDPQHRRGKDLLKEFAIWVKSNSKLRFYNWLDEKEKNTGNYIPRMIYRILNEHQKQIQATYREGKIFLNDKPCDTSNFKGKIPKFSAFSFSENNELFLAEHNTSSNTHASLLGGERVACAGMAMIESGKIKKLTNFSGHYQPGLINLYYAVKNIPKECFSQDAKIVYQKPYVPRFSSWLQESSNRILRLFGNWLYRRQNKTELTRSKFIEFAQNQLIKSNKKFLYKRDKSGNRMENVIFESHLAKTIVENDHTWRPLINRINQWVFNKIKDSIDNPKIKTRVIKYIKKHTGKTVDSKNYLKEVELFLLNSKDLTTSILFHKTFFAKICPAIIGKSVKHFYNELTTYKKIRSPSLFLNSNRGTTTGRLRDFLKFKYPFYKSRALGIMQDKQTSPELSSYYDGKAGKYKPSKKFYKFTGKRPVFLQQKNDAGEPGNNQKEDLNNTSYASEVSQSDISFISGTSGTATRIVSPLIDLMGLTLIEAKEYLMVLGGVLAARGHHSMYEVMVIARNFGFNIQYNHSFYHNQFITDKFRVSAAYKEFLKNYPSIVETHLPISETNTKESYKNVTEYSAESKRKIPGLLVSQDDILHDNKEIKADASNDEIDSGARLKR